MTFKIPISRIIIEIIFNSKNALIAVISLLYGFKVKALEIKKNDFQTYTVYAFSNSTNRMR